MVKNSSEMWETRRRRGFDPCVDTLEEGMAPIPVFLRRKSCGQKILAGYNPWGCQESDTTEVTKCIYFLCGLPPGGVVVKNLPANAGDTGLNPGLGQSPGIGKKNECVQLNYFLNR